MSLVVYAFIVAFWASVFWGSIWIIDRQNEKNTIGLALLFGAIYAFSRITAIPDLLYLGAWLVFLLRLTTSHYNLTLLGAIIVTASTIFSPYLLMPQIVRFVGDSELRAYLVLYGFPIAVFGGFIAIKLRARRAKASAADDGTLPAARVERGGRGRAKTDAPAALPTTPIVAPKPAEPPRADGQPTFLS